MATIEITGLSVNFGGVMALSDVALSLRSGEIVGLIGPNGAGKSTFINCLSGITRPTAGRGVLDAIDLFSLPAHRIAALGIARVFQHPELIDDMTALDNLLIASHRSLRYGMLAELIALPRVRAEEAEARHRARRILARLGLATDSAVRVGNLPYGHRKLIELGRALLTGARFLLLDEPVAGLNEAEIDRFASLVHELREELGLGILLVEHNMGLVSRLCDRAVVLDAGMVIARGTPGEVLGHPKVVAAYLGEEAA